MHPRLYWSPVRPSRQRGFALLITITLLAFLVLLLVSLASLTRVETQVASNNQQLSAARQNALLALNIALGQLQKTVGPDQRTTARADLADPANVNDFKTLPRTGATRWTSAWGNANAGDYSLTPSQIESQVDTATTGSVNRPRLLSWLVSGNEADAVTANAAGAITSPANTPRFTPGATITPASLSGATAITETLTIADSTGTARPARLLVGPNSVSTANASYTVQTTTGTNYTASDYVVAPVVDIQAPAGTVPGLATAATIGRYAYWVGDENIKARANLVDNYLQQTTQAAQNTAKPYSALIAQHSAIRFMDKSNATPLLNAAGLPAASALSALIGNDYNYNLYNFSTTNYNANGVDGNAPSTYSSNLNKVQNNNQLSFISGDNPMATPTSAATLLAAARERFHDVSADSSSVLADTYAGGLKKDLSAALATGWSPVGHETDNARPLFTPANASDYGVPTWGHVRSYFATRLDSTSRAIPVRVPTNTGMGISPVVTFATLGISVYRSGGELRLALQPIFALINPYARPLSAGTAPEYLGFSVRTTGAAAFNVEFSSDDFTTIAQTIPIDLATLAGGPGSYFTFRFTRSALGYGGSSVQYLAASNVQYVSGTNALAQAAANSNYVWLPLGTITDTAMKYRVVSTGSGGRMDVVFSTQPPSGYTPPASTPTSGWYHAVQQIGFTAPTFTTVAGPGVLADGTVPTTPKLVLRVKAILGGTRAFHNDAASIGFAPDYYLRWFAQNNAHRAPVSTRTSLDTYTMASGATNPGNNSYGGIMLLTGDATSAFAFYETSGNTIGAGGYHRPSEQPRIFDTPRTDLPLLSLGQLQNVNLSLIDAYPAWAFGNSLADFRIPGTVTHLSNIVEPPGSGSFTNTYYDVSWLLNRALSDRYFVSSAPASVPQADIDANRPLPNARMTYVQGSTPPTASNISQNGNAANPAFDQAAAHLMLAGGFNINSPSEQAWRAVIGGTAHVPYRYYYWVRPPPSNVIVATTPGSTDDYILGQDLTTPVMNASFSRMVSPPDASPNQAGNSIVGNRELAYVNSTANNRADPANALPFVVAKLARDIVREVKIRGPFLSMGDFANRRLVNTAAGNTLGDTGLKGTLQAALDYNTDTDTATALLPGTATTSYISVNPTGWMQSSAPPSARPVGSSYELNHMRGGSNATPASYKSRYEAGSPEAVTQADMLSTLGPALVARSDTFKIRTYGEVVNPTTGQREGRAWCEAVVQRLPDYVDSSQDATLPISSANPENRAFGRRFKITSFRWLTSDDI